jgi:3-methyladenine DNA glycosylase/8-oxoguanine DNA glycosylase
MSPDSDGASDGASDGPSGDSPGHEPGPGTHVPDALIPDALVTIASDDDLPLSLGVLRRGTGDPTYQVAANGAIWRGCLTPHGPGTVRVRRDGPLVEIAAWGDGAAWLVKQGPAMIGGEDDLGGFPELAARHPLLREALRLHPGLRLIRTGLVMHSLIPAILEQRVTTGEAYRAWRQLVRRHGIPAPGPVPPGLKVPPPARAWALIPSWEWHRAGVDGKRSAAVVRAARLAASLEHTVHLPHAEAAERLQVVSGIGVWTTAETMQRAHGYADALSVGDYHLSKQIGYAMTGERNADDARMLELLAPFRPHRHRAARLLLLTGPGRARHAPRLAPADHRWH